MFVVKSSSKYVLATLFLTVLAIPFPFSCYNLSKEKDVALKKEEVFKYDSYLEKTPDIRVLLLKNVKKAEIEINSSFSISNMDSNSVLVQEATLPDSLLYTSAGSFHIEPVSPYSRSGISKLLKKTKGKIRITPQNNGYIRLNNSKYNGNLLLIPKKGGRFSVLEEINIESYLSGVVDSEMPAKWQDDAIFAQAVAARSYAIYKKTVNKDSQYHINKTDLAYKGSYKRLPRIKNMVNKSSGIVMVYNWELLPGYFHSTCGGHTEDINLVFGLKSILPLSGVTCGYCNYSIHYRWEKEIKKNEIEKKLYNSRIYVKNLYDIEGAKIGPGDHCSTIRVKYSGGTKELNANDFRMAIGPNKLFSTAFKVKNNGNSLIFKGKGWGHGVGLCQYGTQNMAKSGYKWSDILKHYYPGIDLVKIY